MHKVFCILHFQKFVSDPEVRMKRHGAIAEYFIGRWAGQTLPYVGKDGSWDHYTFLGNCPPTPPLSQH